MTKLYVEQRKIGLSILFVFAVGKIYKPTRKNAFVLAIYGGGD